MAQVFNPWKDPPSTGALTGDLASFEINDAESADELTLGTDNEAPEPEHGNSAAMQQALQVISQQAELISNLMKMLGK